MMPWRQMIQGVNNEENERSKVYDVLTITKDDMKAMKLGCNFAAARNGLGLASGTFAKQLPVGSTWTDIFRTEENGTK